MASSDCPTVLRCSSLPLAMVCPGSVRHVDVVLDSGNEASAMGTAAHAAMQLIVCGQDANTAEMAIARGVDARELSILVRFGERAWSELKTGLEQPVAEGGLVFDLTTDAVSLTGHPDVMAYGPGPRAATVIDWKFGRLDADYSAQVLGYALLIFANDDQIETVHGSVVWLRDQEIERYTITRAEAIAWGAALVQRVVDWDGGYTPGAHCGFCPRSHECPAMVAVARRDVAVLGGLELAQQIEHGLADLPDAEIVNLRRKASLIEKVLESLDKATRAVVRERGALNAGDGYELKFTPTKRRDVDTMKAWPVLQQRFKDDEIAEAVTVSLSTLEELSAKAAERGRGARAVRELRAALDETGAVTTREIQQLRLVRKQGRRT